MKVYFSHLDTPVGLLGIEADNKGITQILFCKEPDSRLKNENNHTIRCREQLIEYFNGDRTEFDVTLNTSGTDFQNKVWKEVRKIPFGETSTYLKLASNLHIKNGARAVGAANGSNKIPIIIPCHRIIGSDGSLTGYAGGIRIKQWLLEFENASFQKTLI